MPNPVELTEYYRPNSCLLRRPACAALIASIAAEWTEVENAMVGIVGNAFGKLLSGRPIELADSNLPLLLAMEAAETIRGRLAIMDSTLGQLVFHSGLNERWIKLRSSFIAQSRERNRIIHAKWCLSDNFPSHLIEIAKKGGHLTIKWSVADFQNTNDRISALIGKCFDFRNALVEALNGGDETLRITHSNMLGYSYQRRA